jgi:hypothetical protein
MPFATSIAPSVRVPRIRVPVKAAAPPGTTAMTGAITDSSSVAGSRPSTMSRTGCRAVIEVPKSPCSTPAPQIRNCSGIDSSKP